MVGPLKCIMVNAEGLLELATSNSMVSCALGFQRQTYRAYRSRNSSDPLGKVAILDINDF